MICGYSQAFPFSPSLFSIVARIDEGFASLLQPSALRDAEPLMHYTVSMTEKVRIKSLIEETRVAAVNAASSSGVLTSVQDLSEVDSDDQDSDTTVEPDNGQDAQQSRTFSIPLSLSRVYKKTLEILGDSLIDNPLVEDQNSSHYPS